MRNITTVTNNPLVLALALAAATGLSSTASYAADPAVAYENITVTAQVSAHGAKRLGRLYLQDQGFNYGIGPGAAQIRSITRDGDTWVLQVRYSLGGLTMNQRALLYVNARAGLVSDVAPEREAEQLAAR